MWGIPLTHDVSSGYYWDRRSNSWEINYTDMLVIDGRKILLVPKRLVSFSIVYTPQKYLQHFVLSFLQNEELRLNGPLVQHRKNKQRTRYVTKKSIRERLEKENAINKTWLSKFTEKYPEVFRDFRSGSKSSLSPVNNSEIVSEDVGTICAYLSDKLKQIAPGNADANLYHRTIVGILEMLFYPHICNPAIEHEIHDGRKRIDILFDNCAEKGFFFRLCNTHDIPSRFIMVECKNYTRDVANPELDQIGGRFSPNRGKAGIITCRAVEDMPLLIARCADTFRDSRGLIIPLIDDDFHELLKYKSEMNEGAIDEYLQKRFHSIASL